MGPKPAQQVKLTKKEQRELAEKLKREEEEKALLRKKQEEEERRIKLEEQRKEEERLDKLEKQRLQSQQKELEEWREIITNARQMTLEKVQEIENWEKFKQCSVLPDPQEEAQITTFLTQYKNSEKIKVQKMEQLQIEKILKQVQYSEDVASQVMHMGMKYLGNQMEEDYKRMCDYVREIRAHSMQRLEEITSTLYLFGEDLVEKKMRDQQESDAPTSGKNMYGNKNAGNSDILKLYPNMKDFKYAFQLNPFQKTQRHKSVDFFDNQASTNTSVSLSDINQKIIPSQSSSSSSNASGGYGTYVPIRVQWTSFDILSDQYAYSKDIVVGGVYYIDFYDLVQYRKKMAEWSLKYDYEIKDALKRQIFPTIDQQQLNQYTAIAYKVQFQIPPYVKIYKDDLSSGVAKVSLFCELTKQWSSEQIQDVKYEPEARLISFNTMRTASFAYMQDRCTDFPYKSWKLRCTASNVALIDIEGKRDTFRIEVTAGLATLKGKNDKELAHINNKPMPVSALLYELQKSGINLIPLPQDSESSGLALKDINCENKAIADLVIAVRSFFIKSSRFSGSLPSNQVLVRIHENLEYDGNLFEDDEKYWRSILIYPNKVKCLSTKDSDETYKEEFHPGTEAHGDIQILLRQHELFQKQSLQRMKETQEILFQDTLSRFLRLTHLLTFTQGSSLK